MSVGIYLHIPFCKQACTYCNFHFSTSLRHREDMITAMRKELQLRKSELAGTPIRTVYFGGGTPPFCRQMTCKRCAMTCPAITI